MNGEGAIEHVSQPSNLRVFDSRPYSSSTMSGSAANMYGIFIFEPEVLYDISVYGMTQKLLMLAAVVIVACSLVTVTHSQNDGVKFRLDDLHERVVTLEQLPSKVSEISAKLDAIKDEQQRRESSSAAVETGLVVGIGILLIEKLLAVFGLKLKGN